MVEFINEIVATVMAIWGSFAGFFEAFAEFGMGRAAETIDSYCRTNTECADQSSPTTQLLGYLYVLFKMAPGMIGVFVLARSYFDDRLYGIASAVGYQILSTGLFVFVLGIRPNPLDVQRQIARGPGTLLSAVQHDFTTSPIDAFTTWVVVLGSFFLFSYLMWYMINFLLWFITLTFRQDPFFSDTSAKGHALWLTMIWLFYLTLQPPASAFINVCFVLIIIIGNRAWDKRKSSSSGVDEEKLAKIIDDGETEEEGESRFEWVD